MPETDWHLVTAGADADGFGAIEWTTPGNITASDDSRALATGPQNETWQSHFLVATGAAFQDLPQDAVVTRLEARIECARFANTLAGTLAAARVVVGGAIAAADMDGIGADLPASPAAEAIVTVSGPLDLPASQAFAAGFGVAVAVEVTSADLATLTARRAGVDSVSLKLTWRLPAGGGGRGGSDPWPFRETPGLDRRMTAEQRAREATDRAQMARALEIATDGRVSSPGLVSEADLRDDDAAIAAIAAALLA